jgi:hypothetical protein
MVEAARSCPTILQYHQPVRSRRMGEARKRAGCTPSIRALDAATPEARVLG